MLKLNMRTNFQTFNDKMILSTSKEDKKLLLWDINTTSVVFTYEDANLKNYFSKERLFVIGKDLFSEYLITLQENKSLISVWKTNTSECLFKCSPIEERITGIDIVYNNKLICLATESGYLYIYELFSGNILISTQVSNTKIHSIKSFLRDGGLIGVLCEDYIKIFKIENLLKEHQSSLICNSFIETPNYDSLNNMFYIIELNYILFYSSNKSKIIITDFPNLKVIKSIYLFNDSLLENISIDFLNVYLSFQSGGLFMIDLKQVMNNESMLINFKVHENIFPITQHDSKINVICVSNKFIITGHDDGKILMWNKLTYKNEGTFSQHKGGITNITLVNRPISQYGLNFNIHIDETVIKALKKPSMEYNHLINLKNSLKNEDFINNYLDNELDAIKPQGVFSKSLTGIKIKTENLGDKSLNQDSHINTTILEDSNYLRKKVTELYQMYNV